METFLVVTQRPQRKSRQLNHDTSTVRASDSDGGALVFRLDTVICCLQETYSDTLNHPVIGAPWHCLVFRGHGSHRITKWPDITMLCHLLVLKVHMGTEE